MIITWIILSLSAQYGNNALFVHLTTNHTISLFIIFWIYLMIQWWSHTALTMHTSTAEWNTQSMQLRWNKLTEQSVLLRPQRTLQSNWMRHSLRCTVEGCAATTANITHRQFKNIYTLTHRSIHTHKHTYRQLTRAVHVNDRLAHVFLRVLCGLRWYRFVNACVSHTDARICWPMQCYPRCCCCSCMRICALEQRKEPRPGRYREGRFAFAFYGSMYVWCACVGCIWFV